MRKVETSRRRKHLLNKKLEEEVRQCLCFGHLRALSDRRTSFTSSLLVLAENRDHRETLEETDWAPRRRFNVALGSCNQGGSFDTTTSYTWWC